MRRDLDKQYFKYLPCLPNTGGKNKLRAFKKGDRKSPSKAKFNKTLTVWGSLRQLISTFIKTMGPTRNSRKNGCSTLWFPLFHSLWKFENYLHFLVLAQMTTTSTFHLHFFFNFLPCTFSLHLLHTSLPPGTQTNHYPLPPGKPHQLSLGAQWGEPNRKNIQPDVPSPKMGLLFTQQQSITPITNVLHNRAGLPAKATTVSPWEIPIILHLALFLFIWERDGQQMG